MDGDGDGAHEVKDFSKVNRHIAPQNQCFSQDTFSFEDERHDFLMKYNRLANYLSYRETLKTLLRFCEMG